MPGLPRLNLASSGWVVAQEFDTNDLFANAYDETNRPIQYAARYTWVVPADGIPVFRQVANTQGPIGQWIMWPKGARVFGQWGQVFPAITTDATHATPYKSSNVGDAGLGTLVVAAIDGAALVAGTPGLVVAGTDLGAQRALFFSGGGGSIVGGPFTTADLVYCSVDGQVLNDLVALGVGGPEQVLTVSAGLPVWAPPPAVGYVFPAPPALPAWPADSPAFVHGGLAPFGNPLTWDEVQFHSDGGYLMGTPYADYAAIKANNVAWFNAFEAKLTAFINLCNARDNAYRNFLIGVHTWAVGL